MVSAAGNTCLSNSLAIIALFIFLIDRFPLASAHGNSSSGWGRTSLIRIWRLSATRTRQASCFLSACRMTLFELLAEVFFQISENLFSLFFVILSRNWASGISSSGRSRLNSSYAAMTNRIKLVPCYIWRGQGTCRHTDKLTFVWVERVRPVIVLKLDNGLNVIFIPSYVQVWVTESGTHK